MTSATSEVSLPCRNCSSRSQDSEDDIVGGGTGEHTPAASPHPLNFRSIHLENGKKSTQLSPTNSNSDHSSTTTNKKCMNCNGGTSSPSTASTTSTGKVSHAFCYGNLGYAVLGFHTQNYTDGQRNHTTVILLD